MAYNFNGKRALVTGAGRGIGRGVVQQLAKCGAEVIAVDKIQENLISLKSEINTIKTICVDLADWSETEKALENIGVVELLVNNAGLGGWVPFGEITEDYFDRLFAVNVKAIINVSQIVTKVLKENDKSGSIVNLASLTTTKHFDACSAYSASKAAVDRLTKSMAVELGPKIRVNAVNPTVVYTDMTTELVKKPDVKEMLKNTPLQRYCNVADIVPVVMFLLSDNAAMVNGVSIQIDGGLNAFCDQWISALKRDNLKGPHYQ